MALKQRHAAAKGKQIQAFPNSKRESILYGTGAILCLLAVWQVAAMTSEFTALFPTPLTVLEKFFEAMTVPVGIRTLWGHVFVSMKRVMVGYCIAAAFGLLLGFGMALSKWLEAVVMPVFEFIRPVPPLAWIPMAIIWFGIGETTKYFIIFVATFTTITVNAYTGAKRVDPILIGAGQMLGASKVRTFFTIILPSSVPQIFAGLQVALSSGWMAVVAAEMVRSDDGIGWLIIRGMEVGNAQQIMVGMVAIGIVGFLIATGMSALERRACRWNQQSR